MLGEPAVVVDVYPDMADGTATADLDEVVAHVSTAGA
jgi:hypothetical protein